MKDKKTLFILLFAVSLVIIDQIVKYIVSRSMDLHQSIPLIKNVLHFTYIQNTGAGFGIFKGQQLFLIFISLVIIGGILFYLDRVERQVKVPFALILGGAVGNLIDRMFLGYVIDFIDFRIWPVFNVADTSITIGAMIIAYKCFMLSHQKKSG